MSAPGFTFNDGGRAASGRSGHTGDCVCRAVAIASGRPYDEVYAVLAAGNSWQRVTKRTRKSATYRSVRNGVYTRRKWFKDYMVSLGFEWVPTMQIGSGCKVHLDRDELPAGRLVVMVSRHACAMIDGIIHDTHDPRRDTSWIIDRPEGWRTLPLKPGQTRNVNGIATPVGGRCVYGYWRLAQ
jgi:hypothetical protein